MDPSEVVKVATNHGWEAGMLAVIMMASMGCLGYLVKLWMAQAATREERMAGEIKGLQAQLTALRDETFKVILDEARASRQALDRNTAALHEMATVLGGRPCLMDGEIKEAIGIDSKAP